MSAVFKDRMSYELGWTVMLSFPLEPLQILLVFKTKFNYVLDGYVRYNSVIRTLHRAHKRNAYKKKAYKLW